MISGDGPSQSTGEEAPEGVTATALQSLHLLEQGASESDATLAQTDSRPAPEVVEVTDTAALGFAWGFHPVDVVFDAGLPGGQAAHREGYKADAQEAVLHLSGATMDNRTGRNDQPYWRAYAANEEGDVLVFDYAPERGHGWDMRLPDGRSIPTPAQQLTVGKSIEYSIPVGTPPGETSERQPEMETGAIREIVLVNVRSSGSESSSGKAADIVGLFQAGVEAHGGPPAPLEAYAGQRLTEARMDLASVQANHGRGVAAEIRGSPEERVGIWAQVAEQMRTGNYQLLREEIGKELQGQEARRTQAEQQLERGFFDDQALKDAQAYVGKLRDGLTWIEEQQGDAEGKEIVTEVVTDALAAAERQLGDIGPGRQIRISQEASQQIWYLRGLLGITNAADAHQ